MLAVLPVSGRVENIFANQILLRKRSDFHKFHGAHPCWVRFECRDVLDSARAPVLSRIRRIARAGRHAAMGHGRHTPPRRPRALPGHRSRSPRLERVVSLGPLTLFVMESAPTGVAYTPRRARTPVHMIRVGDCAQLCSPRSPQSPSFPPPSPPTSRAMESVPSQASSARNIWERVTGVLVSFPPSFAAPPLLQRYFRGAKHGDAPRARCCSPPHSRSDCFPCPRITDPPRRGSATYVFGLLFAAAFISRGNAARCLAVVIACGSSCWSATAHQRSRWRTSSLVPRRVPAADRAVLSIVFLFALAPATRRHSA